MYANNVDGIVNISYFIWHKNSLVIWILSCIPLVISGYHKHWCSGSWRKCRINWQPKNMELQWKHRSMGRRSEYDGAFRYENCWNNLYKACYKSVEFFQLNTSRRRRRKRQIAGTVSGQINVGAIARIYNLDALMRTYCYMKSTVYDIRHIEEDLSLSHDILFRSSNLYRRCVHQSIEWTSCYSSVSHGWRKLV